MARNLTHAVSLVILLIQVLIDGGLHSDAQQELNDARALTDQAQIIQDDVVRNSTIDQAVAAGQAASKLMVLVGFRSIAPEDGRIRESSEESNVGGSTALMASRRGFIVRSIQDKDGTAIADPDRRPEGFTVRELQVFNNIPPTKRSVIDFFGSLDGVNMTESHDPSDLVPGNGRIDILVTGAVANTINEKNVDKLISGGVRAIVEGANNSFKLVRSQIQTKGLHIGWGSTLNTGGVTGSSRENQDKHQQTVEEIVHFTLFDRESGRKYKEPVYRYESSFHLDTRDIPKDQLLKNRLVRVDGLLTDSPAVLKDPNDPESEEALYPELPANTNMDIVTNPDGSKSVYVNNFCNWTTHRLFSLCIIYNNKRYNI